MAYALLYYTGLRINEIREIKHTQILDAITSSQLNAIHHKTCIIKKWRKKIKS